MDIFRLDIYHFTFEKSDVNKSDFCLYASSMFLGHTAWMTSNVLLPIPDTTWVIVLGPEHIRMSLSNYIITLNSIALAPSTNIRNIRVIFKQNMSFSSHVKYISRSELVILLKSSNLLTYKALNVQVSPYVKKLIVIYKPTKVL